MKKVHFSKAKSFKPGNFINRLDLIKQNRFKKVSTKKFLKIKNWKRVKKVALVFGVIFAIVALIGGAFGLTYLQQLNDRIPSPDTVFPELPVASEIYDRLALNPDGGGTRLYRVFNRFNSDNFDITEVPDKVKLAFIAAEDKEFFDHGGFNAAAILRCGLNYIKEGARSCGGSTITQQLVKITTQKAAPAIERKIEELLMAVKVEQQYSKDEILQMYLRATPFGSSIVGLKTASSFYFGKEPKDLTLAEAAILAAIIQDPNYLSPTVPIDNDKKTAQEKVRERQLYVLDQLNKNIDKFNSDMRKIYNDPERDDTLTPEMIEEAVNEDWVSKLRPGIATDIKAGHFVNYVLEQLQKKNYKNGTEPFNITELQTGGYKIYTTLDYNIQQVAERYAQRAGTEYSYWNVNNSAVMTTTPSNGQIISWMGSKSYNAADEGCDAEGKNCKFNPQVDVLRSLQEPGSSNKPLGYYLGYKEGKIFTGSLLPDIPIKLTDANGNFYEPKNWNGSFLGIISANNALAASRNIPAITLMTMIGVNNYVETAKQFGYTSYTGQYGESAILGGASVLPYEHAQAYGVFANGGDLVELNPILKIEDKAGNVVYEASVERKQVADPQGVYLLNQTIKNYDGYSWDGREMAGKTGTTENSMDAWFMAYSPDFTSVCWVGNNNNDPMDQNYGYPPYVIKPWCQDYLREIGNSPYMSAKTPFTRPGGIIEGGGDCNEEGCLGLERGFMIEGRIPPRDIESREVQICTDQRERVARPIDIAIGMAEAARFNYYKMPQAFLQQYLDEFLTNKHNEKPGEFMPNGGPTQQCDRDRNNNGVDGPFFPALTANFNGTRLGIQGSVFTTQGNITGSVRFRLNNTNLPASCITNTHVGFDLACELAGTNVPINNSNILVAIATDSRGVTNNSQNVQVNINPGITFDSLPSGTCSLPCAGNISMAYSGPWSLSGYRLFVVRNGAAPQQLAPFNATTDYNWVAAATGTYYFFITANTQGAGGEFRSANSSNVVVN